MKRIIIFLFFLVLLSCKAYSNDGWIEISGGNYSIVDSQNSEIRLIRERMIIDLYETYYNIRISYTFYNDGPTVTLDIGFPEYATPEHYMAGLSNFRSYINGKSVETRYVRNSSYVLKNKAGINNIEAWHIKKVTFTNNKELNSIVEYSGQYSALGGYGGALVYLYGTARCWKNGIENFTIEVNNHANLWINEFKTQFVNYTLKNEDDILIINAKQIIPNLNDTFELYVSTNYRRFLWADDTGWYFKDVINENELKFFSKDQLRILRNSLYAWHGFIFSSKDMIDFFNKQSWYRPNNSFNENLLSENERKNIELIRAEERRRE
jgi:hypothetical protein